MRILPILLGSTLVLGLGSGCVFSVGGGGEAERHEIPKPPTVVVMPANSEDAATLAEIDAATKLSFDDGKVQTLRNVAARPSLTPPAQVHLINTVLRTLSFDASKVNVLLVLIENPAFSPAAKEAIFRQLERLQFDATRTQVMAAIQKRSATP